MISLNYVMMQVILRMHIMAKARCRYTIDTKDAADAVNRFFRDRERYDYPHVTILKRFRLIFSIMGDVQSTNILCHLSSLFFFFNFFFFFFFFFCMSREGRWKIFLRMP